MSFERKATEAVKGESGRPAGRRGRLRIGRQVAVAALRYFMLRYGRNKVIAFDFEEALRFEGDTGPYLQYSVVRVQNIFRKLVERFGIEESAILPPPDGRPLVPAGLSERRRPTSGTWS